MTMRAFRTTMVMAAAAAAVAGSAAAAPECAGNACGSVSVTWTGACYNVVNNGGRNARVSMHTGTVGLSRSLKPGENWVPALGSYCVKGYVVPYHADVE